MSLYKDILKGIIVSTHCHSCNGNTHVSLSGYVGRYCEPMCNPNIIYTNECIKNTSTISISKYNTY